MKLQKKYVLIFFSLFVALSLALSLTSYFLSNHILLKKYEELSAGSLSYLLDITDRELDQLSSTFIFIANNPTVHERIVTDYSGDGDAYEKLTRDYDVTDMFRAMSTFDIFSAISIIYIEGINGEEYWYPSGADFLDRDQLLKGIDIETLSLGSLEYFGVAENLNPYSEGSHTLRFAKTLTDIYGNKTGVVYFELDADYFQSLYDNEYNEQDTKIYLTDQFGNIIYHEDSFMLGRSFESMEVAGVVVDKTLNRYGWHLISESPTSQIYNESGLIINVTLIMAIISIAAALVLIIIITDRIVRPIKYLTSAMNEVRNGDLDTQVYHISNDEIGELADNFNLMTRQLQENLDHEIAHNKALNDAEYKALQAQINPHFMYNALNSLKWLAGIQKADNIIELVDALWTLLRMTSSLKGQFVTLYDEMEVIRAYCAIQQVRYKGKFDVAYNVEESHLKYILPKYILQPFVENAIFHGIAPQKGPGTIRIDSTIDGSDLVLSVSDDGVGMTIDKANRLLVNDDVQQHSSGLNNIGVKNVQERLRLLYGKDYGIKVDSELGKGTRMTIKIPIKTKVTGDENV